MKDQIMIAFFILLGVRILVGIISGVINAIRRKRGHQIESKKTERQPNPRQISIPEKNSDLDLFLRTAEILSPDGILNSDQQIRLQQAFEEMNHQSEEMNRQSEIARLQSTGMEFGGFNSDPNLNPTMNQMMNNSF